MDSFLNQLLTAKSKWKVCLTVFLLLLGTSFLAPTIALAQTASIAGEVNDTTGGVLPGVTVVAASPALIEGSRTVVTDGTGVYRIVSLRPGTYSVTFTLPGFGTIVREGIELQGSFAATVDIELAVGGVEESVTVTGASPTVDVQQAQQQDVFSSDVLEALPTGRTVQNLAVLVPGVVSTKPPGVGGTDLLDLAQMSVHGSETSDYRVQQDGFILGNAYQSYNGFVPNMGSSAEATVNTAGSGADWWGSGLVLNVIPKEGSNTYSGDIFVTAATEGWQSDNLSERVQDLGLTSSNRLKDTYDINPSFGGPIIQDKLWFYASGRMTQVRQFAGGTWHNKNAGIVDSWTYDPDYDRQAISNNFTNSGNARFTYQANRNNKLGLSYEYQRACVCDEVGIGTAGWGQSLRVTPEAAYDATYPDSWAGATTWTSTPSNRLLIEAGFMLRNEKNGSSGPRPAEGDPTLGLIPVFDFGTGYGFHGRLPVVSTIYSFFSTVQPQMRASVSYVTGTHSFKVGFNHLYAGTSRYDTDNNHNLRYFLYNGFPFSIVQSAAPYHENMRQSESGIYAQDVWTIDRLTLNLGVRFDRYRTTAPPMVFGPGPLTPDRNFTTPELDHYNQKDITPRASAVYDLFGNGKTAIRVGMNKYVQGHSVDIWDGNPAELITRNPGRDWVDGNFNMTADCDLSNPAAQGPAGYAALGSGTDYCGPIPADWGQAVFTPNTRFNPDTISGWGNRGWNWEFSTGVQHELMQGVSLDVGYYRKIFGNLLAINNEAFGPEFFDTYTLTAPTDAGLPGGGGYEVGPFIDPKPGVLDAGIPNSNYQTFADEFGDSFRHWNGVDVNLNARLQNGLQLAGGFSTGRISSDNCDVVSKTGPEAQFSLGAPSPGAYASHRLHCGVTGNYLTNVKAYGSYVIPNIDVQLSATYQNLPGGMIEADVIYTPTQVSANLGRMPTGGGNIGAQVVAPNSLYGERMQQLDLRVGKILYFAGTRTNINLDIYNALNADAILLENANMATFRRVDRILLGRVVKISASFGF